MPDHEHGDFTQQKHDRFEDDGGHRAKPVTEKRADQAQPTKAYPREESHEYDPNADGGPDNPSDPSTYPDPQKQGPETSREEPSLERGAHDPYDNED